MSIFFDFEIKISSHHNISSHETVTWHSYFPLLAVSHKCEFIQPGGLVTSGLVNVFLDEGEQLSDATMQRSCLVSAIKWHPKLKVLAVGWENGELVVYNEEEHFFSENTAMHNNTITVLEWSNNGSRLITGDQSGCIAVWSITQHGHLIATPLNTFNIHSAISHCVVVSNDMNREFNDGVSGSNFNDPLWPQDNILPEERLEFYISTTNASVLYGAEQRNTCIELFKEEGNILKLFLSNSKPELITISHNLYLTVYTISSEGSEVQQISRVKLTGRAQIVKFEWLGMGLLAMAGGDNGLRVLDLAQNASFMLSLSSFNLPHDELATCVAYNPIKLVLAAGTSNEKVVIWKFMQFSQEPEDSWEALSVIRLQGFISDIHFCFNKDILCANNNSTVYILKEHTMSTHYNQTMSAVQTSAKQISLSSYSSDVNLDIKSDIKIIGTFITKDHVCIWNGERVQAYEIIHGKAHLRPAGSFSSNSRNIMLYKHNVYIMTSELIQITTLQGTIKGTLKCGEGEGDIVCMYVNNGFLLAITSNCYIWIWNIASREAKLLQNKKLSILYTSIEAVQSVSCNIDCTKVSFMLLNKDGYPDTKVLIWNLENDTISYLDFISGNISSNLQSAENDENMDQNLNVASIEKDQRALLNQLKDRNPISHHWDALDSRLLVCEAHGSKNIWRKQGIHDGGKRSQHLSNISSRILVSLFIDADGTILVHDYFQMDSADLKLIGVDLPYYILTQKRPSANSCTDLEKTDVEDSKQSDLVNRKHLREFIGMEESDQTTIKSMSDYTFYSTQGNMDKAFQSIKLIKNQAVWENMAKMCVKNRRLDVAAVCLGNMGHACGARALRESKKEPQIEARVAMLAIQLNMNSEAEELYKACGRYDLLNTFYQACGHWEKAIYIAETEDRMHLKPTHYKHAQFLEAIGNIDEAISSYEKSGTHQNEVPRMLFDDKERLAEYILNSEDRNLRKWWAEYQESLDEMETAMQYYEAAQDHMSIVRMMCYFGDFTKAKDYAERCDDKAACYHLASQLFKAEDAQLAINLYAKAGCYRNAISIAREEGLDTDLMRLSLLAKPNDMIEVARYFESKHQLEKAALLYHKGGDLSRAIELYFQIRDFNALLQMVEDLDDNLDPSVINKCADFFIEFGQFYKAVELLIMGGRLNEALTLCIKQNVHIDAALSEKMTPPKPKEEDDAANSERIKILESIAESCFKQQSWDLAAKKFIEAGLNTKAMTSLLKSGNIKKIISFTNVSKDKKIYIMTANFLQALDWKKDPDILRNITHFYSLGKAFDSLAMFYEHCAQVEVDDYKNYKKAVDSLNAALNSIKKAKKLTKQEQDGRVSMYEERISLINHFIEAKSLVQQKDVRGLNLCQSLLDNPKIDAAVKVGDIYGLIVEHHSTAGNFQQAFSLMEELRTRDSSVNLSYYINAKTIDTIHKELGMHLDSGTGSNVKNITLMDANNVNDVCREVENSKEENVSDDEDILEDLLGSPE